LLSRDSKTTLIYWYILLQSTSCPSTSRRLSVHIRDEAVRGYHQLIIMGSILLPLPLIPSLLSPSLTQSTAGGRYTGVARLWCVPSPRRLCSGCPAGVITLRLEWEATSLTSCASRAYTPPIVRGPLVVVLGVVSPKLRQALRRVGSREPFARA
jgi:hypothetical protein